jgi:hypothetical protein
MARKVEVPGAGHVRVFNPWIGFVLSLVTLGLYYIFWYGMRQSELNDYGEAVGKGENPLRVGTFGAVAAITVGGLLIVPPFISEWRFYKRIGRAQELAGLDHRISHITGFLLFVLGIFFLPFEIVYSQHHLNRLWEQAASELGRQRLETGAH